MKSSFPLSWLSLVLLTALSACGPEGPGRSPDTSLEPEAAPQPQSTTEPVQPPPRPVEPNLVGRPVTDVHGNPVIRDGEVVAESATRPWSAWWFPSKDPYLFEARNGKPAPLQKYDQYVKKVYKIESGATTFERNVLFDPEAGGWEGLCDAWSKASLLEPEPTKAAKLDDVEFDVGDLKALLVKSYEVFEGAKQFGQRNNGGRGDVYDDLFPDQFHRLLQVELFENGRAFIMDRDPGIPVWNTPIWKAAVRVDREPADPTVMHVSTWLTGARPDVPAYDFVGTLSVNFHYTYDLYGVPRDDGSFEVLWGVWTGPSVESHPDFMTVLPKEKVRKSLNKELNIQYVDEILSKARK